MTETLFQDLRYGLRMLRRSPGFTAVAVLCLALGVGANTAIFSVVDAVLLAPWPAYPDLDRLVWVYPRSPSSEHNLASPPEFIDWRDQNHVFEQIAAETFASFNFSDVDQPEELGGLRVSEGYFDLRGVKSGLGRTFLPEEHQPGKDHVVILTHELWKRRFGADPGLIGKTVALNGEKFTVVGVLLPNSSDDGVLTPLAFDTNQLDREHRILAVWARLKQGVTRQRAQAEMDVIARSIEQRYPGTNKGWGVIIEPLRDDAIGRELHQALLVLFGAVSFVLLIACANVANLTLARGASRQKEIAIRAALGAGRLRMMRQLLTESVLLSIVGGALGLLLAYWLVHLLIVFVPPGTLPVQVGVNSRLMLYALGISLLTGALFGTVPAWKSSKPNLNESLKEGGRSSAACFSRRGFLNLLVVSEVALALILMVGAGLMVHSFLRLLRVHPGFQPENILTMTLALPGKKYPQGHQVTASFREMLQRIEVLPGVKQSAIVRTLPFYGDQQVPFSVEGHSTSERPLALFQIISPSYFRAMSIPLLKGRNFTEQDTRKAPAVTIVNKTMVRRFFPNEDPIGKRVMIESWVPGSPVSWEIVGVSGDVKQFGLDAEEIPTVHVPYSQSPSDHAFLIVRSVSDPMAMGNMVRGEIRAVDKDQAVSGVRTMEEIITESVLQPRFRVMLFGMFAALALVLAAIGIYGVISYFVAQRTHEIGIRVALGARRGEVLKLVVRQGMALTLMGGVIGLAGAFALTRVMASLLYGVSATDPLTFGGVALLLAGVALLACYIPARRATRVDPMVALRHE